MHDRRVAENTSHINSKKSPKKAITSIPTLLIWSLLATTLLGISGIPWRRPIPLAPKLPLHHALSTLPQSVTLVTRPFQTAGCGTGQSVGGRSGLWGNPLGEALGLGEIVIKPPSCSSPPTSLSSSILEDSHELPNTLHLTFHSHGTETQFGCERTDTRQGDLNALVPPRKTPVSKQLAAVRQAH